MDSTIFLTWIFIKMYQALNRLIARKQHLSFHLYADETHLYIAFKLNNADTVPLIISNIQNCVINIKSWVTTNMLQINMDKTGVLVLMNKSPRNPTTINKIKIDSVAISTASSVRNLGDISKLRGFCANLPGWIYSTSAQGCLGFKTNCPCDVCRVVD